jgi:Zn-dependent protease
MSEQQLATLPLWYVAFLLSLTCHEASHALVAMWGGDMTASQSGQVTLNPLPHIRRELFGTVIVPLVSFFIGGSMIGWGSAPYDPRWEQRHPKRAALMALAGPTANFLLAIVSILLFQVFLKFGVHPVADAGSPLLENGGAMEGILFFLNIMFMLNVLLGCFNLIPAAPLDGHTAIGLLLPEATFRKWLAFIRSPMPSLLGLLLAWRAVDYIYFPVLSVFKRIF